jgi:hypothetical protein
MNIKLVESLIQVILSLSDQERSLLEEKYFSIHQSRQLAT